MVNHSDVVLKCTLLQYCSVHYCLKQYCCVHYCLMQLCLLQCRAVQCKTPLHYIAQHCNSLNCTAIHRTALHFIAQSLWLSHELSPSLIFSLAPWQCKSLIIVISINLLPDGRYNIFRFTYFTIRIHFSTLH